MAVETQPKGRRSRVRGTLKGGAVDLKAREEVRTLLGDAPRRRDLLIEHLHKIQDRYGHLSAAHIVALAAEMKMAMAEVYEVAGIPRRPPKEPAAPEPAPLSAR